MGQPRKARWNISNFSAFRPTYEKLDPIYKIRVMRILNDIRFYKDPRKYSKTAQCPTMPVRNNEEYFVLSVSGDSEGEKPLRIMMRMIEETRVIWPLWINHT